MACFMGIDIGSAASKGVLTGDGEVIAWQVIPSGFDYRAAAETLRQELLAEVGLSVRDVTATVATGQSAASVVFADRKVADIRCCARGMRGIFPSVRTIVDVQAQSSQVIQLSEQGQVVNFVASERCATGSGRFMEVIASVLQIDLADVGPLSLKAKQPVTFTTGCAVFGESEAVSRVAEGVAREDILAGVHRALASKIVALINRVGLEKDCAISGGGGLDVGLVRILAEELGVELLVPPRPQLVTALGAALMAAEEKA